MQPVWNEPALTFDRSDDEGKHRWLALSELHIGFESDLARKGAYLKSRSGVMADRILGLAETTRSDHLLILGDVKQRVAGTSAQERRDVPAFFERMSGFERVLIARGNHDVGLQELLPRQRFANVSIQPATGLVIRGREGDVGALHGHAWPKPAVLRCDDVLVGHTHAAARLIDEGGRATTEWAWARGRLDPTCVKAKYGRPLSPRIVVFPPFNPLLGGSPVNLEGLLGPMRRLVEESSLRLTLLDGRDLGKASARRRAR